MGYAGDDDESPQSDQQKALARRWGKRLDRALRQQRETKQEKRFRELRAYVRGDVGGDGEAGLVRTNIIHSNFAAILPQIYAKNPEIAVTPTEAAGATVPWVPGFCRTLQSVLGRVFVQDARLKKRAKAAILAAMTTGIGWAKVSWQKDIRSDPVIENRIADTQDNIQRIRFLIDEIDEGDDSRCEMEAKQAELEQQLSALRQQAEVSAASGIVIDRILTEDVFLLDDTLYSFDQIEQAEAVAHRVWMTVEQYEETFGRDAPKTANRYGRDKREDSRGFVGGDEAEAVTLVAVFEVWDRISNSVYTLCAGSDEWARDPYVPQVLGKRFFPFFALAFNPVDGRVEPISDAELLVELQDEYNTTRTNFAEHRKENLPVRIYRKSGDLTDNDIQSLANRSANQWVGIEGDPSQPIEKDVAILQNPPVDPATYDVGPILRDAEMVLGAGDASKGFISKAKTATEAEIMAQGLQSRVAERQDVVEDWIGEMAKFSAELCLQELSPQEAKRIAGEDAVWPQLNREQVFDLVNVDIRAGSAGRPNKAKEREQWGQMLPQIQQSVTQIMQLREAGQNDMAETMIKLMEETLRRFDERIDIESFLPPRPEGEKPEQQIPPELQQQMQQAQEAMQQMQAENQQLRAQVEDKQGQARIEQEKLALQQAQAGEEIAVEREKAQQQAAVSLETARIKAEADMAATIEVERIKAETEREKLASQERIAMMQAEQQQALAAEQQAAAECAAHQDDAHREAVAQMADMLASMREAVCAMGERFSGSLNNLHTQISAPKRVIRDAEGNMIGVETVMH
jgi:hypothetical protein